MIFLTSAIRNVTLFIARGTEASDGQFPFHVVFLRPVSGTPFCGGSLITDQLVLTAAHCVHDIGTDFVVKANTTWLQDPSAIVRRPKDCVVHDNFSYTGNEVYEVPYDVALVKLTSSIQGLLPANLPKVNETVPEDDLITLGFGRKEHVPFPSASSVLSFVNVQLLNNSCPLQDDILICTQGKPNDTGGCQGDSGGALYHEPTNTIQGVASFGDGICGSAELILYYMKVTELLEWISNAISTLIEA